MQPCSCRSAKSAKSSERASQENADSIVAVLLQLNALIGEV